MPRAVDLQTQFNAGELSLGLLGRVDIADWKQGAEVMLNWQPIVQGGVRRADGTEFLATLYGTGRLEAFIFSADLAYLMVFVENGVQIYNQNGTLHQSISGAPWTVDNLQEMDFAQNLDTIILVHDDFAPRRLFRSSGNVFALEDLSDETVASGIYIERQPTAVKITTWEADKYYSAGDLVIPTAENETTFYYIATVPGTTGSSEPTWSTTIDGTTADGTVAWTTVDTVVNAYAWSDSNGWPRCTTFFEDRLFLVGTTKFPNGVWASKAGNDYFDFEATNSDDASALDLRLLSEKGNIPQWILALRKLVIGTVGSEWSTIQETSLTPNNSAFLEQTGIGSARIKPVSLDGAILHLTKEGDQLRSLIWDDVEQAHTSTSLSLRDPRAVKGATQIAKKAADEEDDANLVYVTNGDNGELGIMLHLRDQEVLAWCRRSFEGNCESVAVVNNVVYLIVSFTFGEGVYAHTGDPTTDVYEDDLYEEDGGSSSRFLVRIDSTLATDFSKSVTIGTAGKTFTGFDHLAGQTVQMLVDGFVHTDVVVSDAGVITTEYDANTVVAGIAIPTPTLKPMPVAFDGGGGNIAHLLKRIVWSIVQVKDAKQLTVNGKLKYFTNVDDDPSQPIAAYSGLIKDQHLGWTRTAQLTFTAPHPLPVTILSLSQKVAY
jgi:hypothetical protein